METLIPAWSDGVLTPIEKLEVHRLGLRHKAVSIFVLCGKNVLLQRRALSKYHTPGLWANTCCTHPEWGESALDCANRRLQEELGIAGLAPEYRDTIEYRADVGKGMTEHEVVDLFTAKAPMDLAFQPNPDEVMETKWMSYDALCETVERAPQKFTPWLKIYLEEHSMEIFGAPAKTSQKQSSLDT